MAEIELIERNERILQNLPENTRPFIRWFLALTQVHRPTFQCEEISRKMKEWIRGLGYEAEDCSGNLVVRVPACNSSSEQVIALQAHLDMVAVGEFPEGMVEVTLTGDDNPRLVAEKSTLGADDAFGVALMLDFLSRANEFPHPPLELVFTVDEEKGLVGIRSLPPSPFLKFSKCINLDSLRDDKIFIGSAGSEMATYTVDLSLESIEDLKCVGFSLSGLRGGHSGMTIHEGRADAIRWGARIIASLDDLGIPYQIVSLEGGETTNSIPSSFKAVLAVNGEKAEAVIDAFHHTHTTQVMEYFRQETTQFETFTEDASSSGVSCEQSHKIVDFLLAFQSGPSRMSPAFPDSVEASLCLCKTWIRGNQWISSVTGRFNRRSQGEYLLQRTTALYRLVGLPYTKQIDSAFHPWEANMRSKFAQTAKKVCEEKGHGKKDLGILHVCIEPSILIEKGYGDAEIISVCTHIPLAHAIGEYMDVLPAYETKLFVEELLAHYATL